MNAKQLQEKKPLRVKSVIQFDKNYSTIEEQILYFLYVKENLPRFVTQSMRKQHKVFAVFSKMVKTRTPIKQRVDINSYQKNSKFQKTIFKVLRDSIRIKLSITKNRYRKHLILNGTLCILIFITLYKIKIKKDLIPFFHQMKTNPWIWVILRFEMSKFLYSMLNHLLNTHNQVAQVSSSTKIIQIDDHLKQY